MSVAAGAGHLAAAGVVRLVARPRRDAGGGPSATIAACDAGGADVCLALAKTALRAVPLDLPAVRSWLEKACTAGSGDG